VLGHVTPNSIRCKSSWISWMGASRKCYDVKQEGGAAMLARDQMQSDSGYMLVRRHYVCDILAWESSCSRTGQSKSIHCRDHAFLFLAVVPCNRYAAAGC
jgi:hypothetical protein